MHLESVVPSSLSIPTGFSAIVPSTVGAAAEHAAPAHGCVVALTADHRAFDSRHEHVTRGEVARRLAALKRFDYRGEFDAAAAYGAPVYFVPSDTLGAADALQRLGIRGPHDLMGGVVPHPFVSSKVITHPLVDADADRPAGWNARFGERVFQAVLPGFTAFSRVDARRAGLQLLQSGAAARVKEARATGGRGQVVCRDIRELDHCLDGIDDAQIASDGLVLEENLREPVTYSVGQVIVGDTVASYHGVQRETRNHVGDVAYGGSDLSVVRGGFDELLAQPLAPGVRLAIQQAKLYHDAVVDCYPGFFASRINYDIAEGIASNGERRSGVLEQSWRIGGATGAEIAALERFRDRPNRGRVQTACFEVYGDIDPPPDATVYFHGEDPKVGALAKYAVVQHDADPT